MKSRLMTLAIVLLLAISAGMACANHVTVTASPASIPADGNALTELKAVVTDINDDPVANATVDWTKDPSTALGTILDTTSTTDSNGIAKSRLRAPINTGTTTVTATVGSDSGTTAIKFVGPADSYEMDPPSGTGIRADGTSTMCVVVKLGSEDSVCVSDGSIVQFAASAGSITPVALTKDGVAVALLTAGTTATSCDVTATCDSVSVTRSYNFVTAPAEIMVAFDKGTLPADGTSSCQVAAVVTDQYGKRVPDGLQIDFTTDNGTIVSSGLTDHGVATAKLTSASTAATATVSASFGTLVGEGKIGMVGSPSDISVATHVLSIAANGTSTARVAAGVTDANGNLVSDGTVVTFSTTAGSLSETSVSTTDGFAETVLTSSTTPGEAVVTATCGTLTPDQTSVFFSGAPATVETSTSLDSIPSGGTSTCKVLGEVLDSNGYPVADGTPVTFTVTGGGSVASASCVKAGSFSAVFKSPSTPCLATITAHCGSASGSTEVDCRGNAQNMSVTISPSSLPADGTSYAVVEIDARDSSGGPVPDGTSVSFIATRGSITAASTTKNGKAIARLTSSSLSGAGQVTATIGGSVNGYANFLLQ